MLTEVLEGGVVSEEDWVQTPEEQMDCEQKKNWELCHLLHLCLRCCIFSGHEAACGDLNSPVPPPGITPMHLALEARGLNHWTTREVPGAILLNPLQHLDNSTLKYLHWAQDSIKTNRIP